MKKKVWFMGIMLISLMLLAASGVVFAGPPPGNPATYTLDADFDLGTLVNVNHDDVPNQLQLDSEATPFEFIWVAASDLHTIVKIDTNTGQVLGEYLSRPNGMQGNPSRTTVDGNGNVWSANRDEDGWINDKRHGSAVKIGLEENGQCVDRNGNGVIDTSTGLGDVKDWPNITDGVGSTDGATHVAQVQDAKDECILIFQRLPGAWNARHVSVDTNNDAWVAGYPFFPTDFHKLDELTGAILNSFSAANEGCGGYGGLIDGNGVLWSASISQHQLLRYDIATSTGTCIPVSQSYGLGIDSNGYVWNAMWGMHTIDKISPVGVIQTGFPKVTHGTNSRGVVVTADNDVWVANSVSNDVTRLDNDGDLKATIVVGNHPTGVAVDAAGKVWVTNYNSDNVMRIDPNAGGDGLGAVDLTVSLGSGAGPYNYSDMTGSTLIAPPNFGTWTIDHESTIVDAVWGYVTWNSDEPSDSEIKVYAASSTGGVFSAEEEVTNGADLTVPDGEFLRVRVTFQRASTGESPVLEDLTILSNQPPDCSNAYPSQDKLWPPNHKWVPIDVLGVTDPDGDPFTITIDAIEQDEPVDTYGDGKFTPDGNIMDSKPHNTAEVRAERSGTKNAPGDGDGRVYHISFTADDGLPGGTCSGEVLVSVPHDKNDIPVDGGPLHVSTDP
ncbi:MAG: hypothetical protein GY759_13430 [Chloroflexi bacterium]|nr:hypothetical protein [Chloroflexota bacterium]